jgi:hypothetical protein
VAFEISQGAMAVHEKLKKKKQRLWQSNMAIILGYGALDSFREFHKAV